MPQVAARTVEKTVHPSFGTLIKTAPEPNGRPMTRVEPSLKKSGLSFDPIIINKYREPWLGSCLDKRISISVQKWAVKGIKFARWDEKLRNLDFTCAELVHAMRCMHGAFSFKWSCQNGNTIKVEVLKMCYYQNFSFNHNENGTLTVKEGDPFPLSSPLPLPHPPLHALLFWVINECHNPSKMNGHYLKWMWCLQASAAFISKKDYRPFISIRPSVSYSVRTSFLQSQNRSDPSLEVRSPMTLDHAVLVLFQNPPPHLFTNNVFYCPRFRGFNLCLAFYFSPTAYFL